MIQPAFRAEGGAAGYKYYAPSAGGRFHIAVYPKGFNNSRMGQRPIYEANIFFTAQSASHSKSHRGLV